MKLKLYFIEPYKTMDNHKTIPQGFAQSGPEANTEKELLELKKNFEEYVSQSETLL